MFNRLAFTRQCLDRILRHTDPDIAFEVIVVDNGSTDGTEAFFRRPHALDPRLVYRRHPTNLGFAKGNNVGAALARGSHLLFLNNDTLVQPGWLREMLRVAQGADVGIVGIKQLFPYTNVIHHTGIVFDGDGLPRHLYPHADARSPHVNKEREYQAVNGACLLIGKDLFGACGGFDEEYVNGYEDVDLCLAVRERGLRVICCTAAFIYHYGQITENRTADDDGNATLFRTKWASKVKADEGAYLRRDAEDIRRSRSATPPRVAGGEDAIYFADDLAQSAALTWVNAELALALRRRGERVLLKKGELSPSVSGQAREELAAMMVSRPPADGVHVKWSHYWPQHLGNDLSGRINLELFAINYLFGTTSKEPWDPWVQCLRQNHHFKLPISAFCRDVLLQVGVPEEHCRILRPGYSPEVQTVPAPPRRQGPFRFLTVTNSHDLERYGTRALLDAYWTAFPSTGDVVLVVKDYGAASEDTTLRDLIRGASGKARIEYDTEFTTKARLIRLYKSCDAFVSAHRGEGYGMKLLDALACGLPTLTPLFGGPADYGTAENCFPIDYEVVPMGDCLDARSLQITNEPLWAEPVRDSLIHQLRTVVGERDGARRVGEVARRDTIGRFTWDEAARDLVAFVDAIRAAQPRRTRGAPMPRRGVEGEDSPYWYGLRASVLISTHHGREKLLRCLQALARQSILPQEFEAVIVDDGSAEGTAQAIASLDLPFQCRLLRPAGQGPASARNTALGHAEGELVLFLGDDIRADERLLERHLVAHAERPDPFVAILGRVDRPQGGPPSAAMDCVTGDPGVSGGSVEARFFRTDNVSVKREFLLDEGDAVVVFDPCFRYAPFMDWEFAYRLERRGLKLHYVPEAVAYDDQAMELENLGRREHEAGQMAVVFYRKHPALGDLLDVRWLGDGVRVVEQMRIRPEVLAEMRAMNAQTDSLLAALVSYFERSARLQASVSNLHPAPSAEESRRLSNALLRMLVEIQRTRGKVREWYANVTDAKAVEDATTILAWIRSLRLLTEARLEGGRIDGAAVASGTAEASLRQRGAEREEDFGTSMIEPQTSRGRLSWMQDIVLAPRVFGILRRADRAVQRRLRGPAVDVYLDWRRRLKDWLL